MARMAHLILFAWLAIAAPAVGASRSAEALSVASICDTAAAAAARRHGVPLAVMRAISLTETGRRMEGATRPWPWTVNMEGKGVWFDTASEALDYAHRHHDRGARSFDVGCFQLNYRWHGRAFPSIRDMFDPAANADYAARFLAELFVEFGDWTKAAGAYHSRTPEFARKYEARFGRFLSELADGAYPAPEPAMLAALPGAPRINSFPLLQPSAAAMAPGSLVPLPDTATGGRFISIAGQ